MLLIALFGAIPVYAAGPAPPLFLVIVLDGLRPDYVTTDLMPHLRALGEQGVDAPASMYGRPIVEALDGGPDPAEVDVQTREIAAQTEGYRVVLSESVVDSRRYFNYARVER